MASHSSVNYVEPNITSVGMEFSGKTFQSWKVDDDYERAPRLEDYCIAVNLEVEVCSRNNISQGETISSDVLIMSYKTNASNGQSVVNFMGGTKVKTGNDSFKPIPYLTTNYADMYVGDLIDYGTTEMIGIKSIDVEYLKSCVPIITIKFTDVRGLSLFQPNELSRTNSYQGICGINSDNVAQTFFQCFFRVPMPKFTITIKGFYGKPVTYEVMCDKFDTNFNSNTGDFDITARFIGYTYSFLTDISMDALIAAPYSKYHGGKDYWDEQIKDRFTIWNKEHTVQQPMPTLVDIMEEMKLSNFTNNSVDITTSLTEEESYHTEEIEELTSLKNKFRNWYETLFNLLCLRYGKEYCFLFKEDGDDGEYYRILVLANNSVSMESTSELDYEYEKFPDSFKQINQDLYSAVETYNAKGSSFKKLNNVSYDFKDYTYSNLFNKLFVNGEQKIVFNGFHKNCNLPKTQVVRHVFYGIKYTGDTNEEITQKENQHKRHVLSTIYGNGVDQYVGCYNIEVDYRSIRDRINALQADENTNLKERENKKLIKEINKRMLEQMKWYPSVENFARILMAHLETLMNMMYNVVNKCEGRKVSELGVTIGSNGNLIDVKSGGRDDVVPPFPRVTKNIVGDDMITKTEDTWVGEYNRGEKAFEEVDFIDGMFNGIEYIRTIVKDIEWIGTNGDSTQGTDLESNNQSLAIKHPLSSFDFYITRSPYGDSSEISNSINGYEFAGKVAIRMFNILALNNFRKEWGDKIIESDVINKIARTEAENFVGNVSISNRNLLTMLRNKTITKENIIKIITSVNNDTDCPWGKRQLFENNKTNMWLSGYKCNVGNYINYMYPIQGYSFSEIENYYSALVTKKVSNFDGKVSIWTILDNIKGKELLNDNCGVGNLAILDDFNSISKQLNSANSEAGDDYDDFYSMLESSVEFNDELYNSFIEVVNTKDMHLSVCKKIPIDKIRTFDIDDSGLIVANGRKYTNDDTSGFASQSKQYTITDYTITEIFPLSKNGNICKYNFNSSLKISPRLKGVASITSGGYMMDDVLTTNLIMGIRLNNSAIGGYLKNWKTVSYIPRVAALQIGAIIFASGGIRQEYNARIKAQEFLPVGDNREFSHGLFSYINELSRPAKLAYVNYYINWVKTHSQYASRLVGGNNSENNTHYIFTSNENTNRRLLNQNDELVQEMTNELLSPVCILNMSVNSRKRQSREAYELNMGIADKYLDAFLNKLEELYKIDYVEDNKGNLVRTTDEPKKTTDDMKCELYRYMKQLYDKWIPMSSFKDWKLESFFVNDKEEMGHKFYFIDSYYNDISNKLLLNPRIISEKISALLSCGDVNSMLLGFMADILGANKCMLMSIQNFADLKKKGSMDEMFTTIPFNSIYWSDLNKYPSFVVVYPYEPSKNLDIPNNEYNNDGFMLNDENETPQAIRSKSDTENMLPAFGVSYGKQYQSYFKSVNVNMSSPIATQQAIQAKHFIIMNQNSTNGKGVVAQDLYDVYSTQSYTCDVEMMGCAWVQPLMYFVLLNVPMFRGSYLIMKVKHSIKPGDMTTTFTGCRMANVSNRLIEDIFTDEGMLGDEGSMSAYEVARELKADIDNDCPYKIYPLFENKNIKLTSDELSNARKAMRLLQENYHFTKAAAAGICGNIYKESTWNVCALNSNGAFGLCQWREDRKSLLFKKYKTSSPSFEQQIDYINYEWNNESIAKNSKNKLMRQTTPRDAARVVMDEFERCGGSGESVRLERAEAYYEYYDKEYSSERADNGNKNIYSAFFDAINKTAQSTHSISVRLRNMGVDKNGYLKISQENGTDKLHVVFDMILNSDYKNYVQELGWVYNNGGLITNSPPCIIYCKVAEKVSPNSSFVWVCPYGNAVGYRTTPKIPLKDKESNIFLVKSLGKLYSSLGKDKFMKEVPQVDNDGIKLIEKYSPADCESLFNDSDETLITPGEISPGDSGMIGNWNVGVSCAYAISHAHAGSGGLCATYVEAAIKKGGGPEMHCGNYPRNGVPATNLRYGGILKANGFEMIENGTVAPHGNARCQLQAGDVAIIGAKMSGNYHAAMYTASRGWVSDFLQGKTMMNPYRASMPYAVYRYLGKKKT